MKKLSKLMHQCAPQFPIPGVNGYAGEQDGTKVLLTNVLHFESRVHADEEYPDGVPDYLEVHWARWQPAFFTDARTGQKRSYWEWQVVLGCWDNQPYEGDRNPFYMS